MEDGYREVVVPIAVVHAQASTNANRDDRCIDRYVDAREVAEALVLAEVAVTATYADNDGCLPDVADSSCLEGMVDEFPGKASTEVQSCAALYR